MKNKSASIKRQRGYTLFIVVIVFLLLLPLIVGVYSERSMTNIYQSISASSQVAADNVANMALADFRRDIDDALRSGLLEYQGTTPDWFMNDDDVDVRSSEFWETCNTLHLCDIPSLVNAPLGSNPNVNFTIKRLLTPTGVTDPVICGQDGVIGVFYNIFVYAKAERAPAYEGVTLQAVYRTCQKV